jgi:hypothetical protein
MPIYRVNYIQLFLLQQGEIDMDHDEATHTCACGGNCGCQDNAQVDRVYLTQEEYVARLEQYLVDLKAEISAVEEELTKLKVPA